jgi:hypothetical protein
VEDRGDLAHFLGEDREFLGEDGLHAVRKSFVRLVMNFDEEAVRTDRHSSPGKR